MNILRASLLINRKNICDIKPSYLKINKRNDIIRLNSIKLKYYHTHSVRLNNKDDKEDIDQEFKKRVEYFRKRMGPPPYRKMKILRPIFRLIKITFRFISRIIKRRNPFEKYNSKLKQTIFDDYSEYMKSEQERYAQEELYQIKRSMLKEVKARDEDVKKITEEFQNKALKIILNNYNKELEAVKEYSKEDKETKKYEKKEIDEMMKDMDDKDIISRYISEEELNQLITDLHINLISTYTKDYSEKTIEDEMYEGRKHQRIIIEEEKQKQREEEKARKAVEEEEERQRKLKEEEEERERMKKEGKKKRIEDEDIEIKDTDDEATKRKKKLLKEQREEERKRLRERTKKALKLLKSSYVDSMRTVESEVFSGVLFYNLKFNEKPAKFMSYINGYLFRLSENEWGSLLSTKGDYKHGVKSQLLNKDAEIFINPSIWKDQDKNELYVMNRGGHIARYKTDKKVFYFDRILPIKIPHHNGEEIFCIPYIDDQLIFFTVRPKKCWIINKYNIIYQESDLNNEVKFITYPPLNIFKPFTVKDKLYVIGVTSFADMFYKVYNYNFEDDIWEEIQFKFKIPHRSLMNYFREFSPNNRHILEGDVGVSIAKNNEETIVYFIVPHVIRTFVFEFDVEESTITWTKTMAPPLFHSSVHFDEDKLLIVGGMIEDVTSHIISYFDIETKEWKIPQQYGFGDPLVSHHGLFRIDEGKYGTIGGIILHKDTDGVDYGNHVQPNTSQYIILTIPDEDEAVEVEVIEEGGEEESKETDKKEEKKDTKSKEQNKKE